MAVVAQFEAKTDQVIMTTKTNGDHLEFKAVHFGAETASYLALLINSGNVLEIRIREKPPE